MRDNEQKVTFSLPAGGIRRRLLVWGLGLFGTALTIVVAASYLYTVEQIRRDAAELQGEIALVTAERIRDFVQRKIDRFSDTSNAVSLYPLGSKEQELLISLLAKNDGSFTDASIIDANGMEVLKVSDRRVYFPSDLSNQSQSPKFRRAVKGEDYISSVYTSERFQPYVTLATPLWGSEQSVVGVVAAEADLSFLWEVIGGISFGSAGYGYLVDEHGNLIAHKDGSLVLKRINLGKLDKVRAFLRNPTRKDPSPAYQGLGLMNTPVLATYAPVPNLGWAVILEEPVDAALAKVEKLKRYAVVLLIVVLVVCAAIVVWVSQKITRPIQELRRHVATIGAGNLEHRADIRTGDEIEELAAEFNKMTNALQNSYATLEQKVDQRTKEISALYGVTTAVNESLALDDILNSVIVKVADIFRFESTRVYLFNDEMEELELRASFEKESKYSSGTRTFKRGEGIVGHVADSGEPLIFEDTSTDPRYAALSATKAKYKAKQSFFAVFPIKTQSRIFGSILLNAHSSRKLTSDETRLLTSMCEHIAVAVEKARLFRQAESRARQLAVLNTIGAAVSQSLNLDMVLAAALDKMIDALNFDASWVCILNPSTENFELKAYKGIDDQTAHLIARHDLSSAEFGEILDSGEPLVVEDVRNDGQEKHLRSSRRSFPDFGSAAGFPIKAKDKIIGVLYLATKGGHHFSHEELRLIASITQEIGVAVENARLFEQVNRKTAELGQMNSELQEANRAKDEFLSVMSHELRTPLNVIGGYAEVLRQGVLGEIQREQLHAVNIIGHQSKELLRMINEILQVGSLQSGQVTAKWEDVNLSDLLIEIQSGYEIVAKKEIQLHWEIPGTLPILKTDKEKLKHVLQNLINNAIKFTDHGHVAVSVQCLSQSIQFQVKDTGVGIPKDSLPSIFQMFRQLDSSSTRSQGGAGVGLYIVKKFVELLKGQIEVESELGTGSSFTVTLPLEAVRMPPPDPSPALSVRSNGWSLIDPISEEPAVKQRVAH